ncbi:MAG: hypothetical protein ISS77_08200, partial [Phycisphaerae bacterium]|nr:hypothetical protein [Phycisphaerae bacterium]
LHYFPIRTERRFEIEGDDGGCEGGCDFFQDFVRTIRNVLSVVDNDPSAEKSFCDIIRHKWF